VLPVSHRTSEDAFPVNTLRGPYGFGNPSGYTDHSINETHHSYITVLNQRINKGAVTLQIPFDLSTNGTNTGQSYVSYMLGDIKSKTI